MHRPHDVADDQELGDSTIAGIRSCFGPMAHLDFAVAENDNKVVQYIPRGDRQIMQTFAEQN